MKWIVIIWWIYLSKKVINWMYMIKKRYPRLRCLKTERDTNLNIYISSKLMSIPTYTKILKDYFKFINKESNGLQHIYSMFDSIIFYTIFRLYLWINRLVSLCMEICVVTSVSFAKTGVIMFIDIINTNIIIIFFINYLLLYNWNIFKTIIAWIWYFETFFA